MENAEKQRWAKRLRALAERAGVHGDPDRSASSDGILSAEEKARLQLLVFTSGAPSTMANHIRRFEKFERWAHIGKPLKEAIPFDIELVRAMECFVVQATHPTPAGIFMWWVLCMIFASLRFDDAIHVKPHELEVRPEGLFGVSWQTKTERKRRGTKFVVPDVSFSKCAWFKVGLELFDSEFPRVERDFWIPEMENKTSWRSSPPEYARSLQWLHHLAWLAGKEAGVSQAVLDQEDDEIDDQEDRDVTLAEFFVKAPDKGSSYDYKFHVCSSESVEEIACKRAITPEFVHIGSVLPDPKLLCKLCASGGDCLQASDHS
eukprot:s10607_g2.t1